MRSAERLCREPNEGYRPLTGFFAALRTMPKIVKDAVSDYEIKQA